MITLALINDPEGIGQCLFWHRFAIFSVWIIGKGWRWEGWLLEERTDQPMFDLFLDQQVFMDAVRGNERIDQYSAYTEVTTFEQRGEQLYLEGNILIAAYLEREGEAGEEVQVEHVEHRLPFEVLVPVYMQSPGMLSVKAQVPELDLEITGPGWLHLEALLLIEGLSSEGGAIVTCGAQEFELAAQEILDVSNEEPQREVVFESDVSYSEADWKEQLQGADRAFYGLEPAHDESQTEIVPEPMGQWDRIEQIEQIEQVESIKSIEPVEQVESVAPASAPAPEPLPELAPEPAPEPVEAMREPVEMRSLPDDQVPIFPEEEEIVHQPRRVMTILPEIMEQPGMPQASYNALPEHVESMTAAEWFWKTLPIPAGETRYTLKYRVVQAEETLEEIAGYYQVKMTELLLVNHLANEYVSPGEVLYIPVI